MRVVCPVCSSSTRVLESRSAEGGVAVRRRRACTSCGRRFTTYERPETGALYVRKRGGERQRFDRSKLRTALLRAAHKREVTAEDVDAIVARVEAEAADSDREISSARIGEACLEALRDLDYGAYLQFAGTLPDTPEFAANGRAD